MKISDIKNMETEKSMEKFMEEPNIASNGENKAWLMWIERRDDRKDTIYFNEYVDAKWSDARKIIEKSGQYEFAGLCCAKGNMPMAFWVSIEKEEWILLGSPYDGEAFGKPERISPRGNKVSNPSVVASENGMYAAAWENCDGGKFKIMCSIYRDGWNEAVEITDEDFNSYEPSIAVDSVNNAVWIAYSRVDEMFQRSVFLKRLDIESMGLSEEIEIARGGRLKNRPNFNTNPSIMCDSKGKIWVAYENDSKMVKRSYTVMLSREETIKGRTYAWMKKAILFYLQENMLKAITESRYQKIL